MSEENKKTNAPAEEEEQEISLDDLDEVAGGVSLRDAPKQKTTQISSDTIHRI